MNADWIAQSLQESAELKQRLAVEQSDAICRAALAMAKTIGRGGKVLLFGNGGSAADAQHIAAEFVGRFLRERAPWPALALTTDTSALTAIGNDFGFEQVFARQLQALGSAGDMAVGISTSGRSKNVLAAVAVARERGLTTVGLSAGDGGPLAEAVDFPILVPWAPTPRVQECHLTIGHLLCEMVENWLLADSAAANSGRRLPPSYPRGTRDKVVGWSQLMCLRESWRSTKTRVVWTSGCFDLLHAGHLDSLRAARALGDVLVVGVNGDESVRRLKGPSRPIVPAAQRVELLAGLECVDHAIVFEELTPERSLARLQPDVHCKGAEYAPPHGKPVAESALVESYGGRLAFLPMRPGTSTSDLVEKIRQRLVLEGRR